MSDQNLLLLIVSNEKAELGRTLSALKNLPALNWNTLIIDDASQDGTFEAAEEFIRLQQLNQVKLIRNSRQQGLGGNLKVGFRYAIDRGMKRVATAPGSAGQDITVVQTLFQSLDDADPGTGCIVGVTRSPSRRLLTFWQNLLSGVRLQDWQSPYRCYATSALQDIGFEFNTPEAHFNMEVLQQLLDVRHAIKEIPIPAAPRRYPGRFLAHTKDALKTSLKFRLQKYNLFYDVRYHPELLHAARSGTHPPVEYHEKFGTLSPHTLVCQDSSLIPPGSRVLDLGCSTGYVAKFLALSKGCQVTGVDILPPEGMGSGVFTYRQLDLEKDREQLFAFIDQGNFDVILMLDVLEHLSEPELFLLDLYKRNYTKTPKYLFSTGNVSFVVIRLMLLAGYFNYGNKGILDVTHKRLFSLRTFKNLLDQTGFIISQRYGFPLPYRELGLPGWLCRLLETANKVLVSLRPSLFAYQILYVATPLMRPEQVLRESLSTPS